MYPKLLKPSRELKAFSREALGKDDAGPLVVWYAFKVIFGEPAEDYSPEVLRKACMDLSIEVAEVNYDKFQACIVLKHNQTQLWDFETFENTVMPFNGTQADPDLLQEGSPAEIIYGVRVMHDFLLRHAGLENEDLDMPAALMGRNGYMGMGELFESSVKEYIATSCYLNGMVCTPVELHYANPRLSQFYSPSTAESREKLMRLLVKQYKSRDLQKMKDRAYKETPFDIQLAKINASSILAEERWAKTRANYRRMCSL